MAIKKKSDASSQTRKIRAKKLSVSIIGAGRVGTAFGIGLRKAGYKIDLLVAKHERSAKRAARLIGSPVVALSAAQFRRLTKTNVPQSSLIIIATPDGVIESIANELAAMFRARGPNNPVKNRVVLHTSGAFPAQVLRPLRDRGFAIGSLHPLISISDSEIGAKGLTHSFFSLEGDAAAVRLGRRIGRDLGGQSFTINSSAKPLYHAAALMASPGMTALFDIAVEMLARCGLSRTRARKILLPLVKSTLENLKTQDPARALTGTFKRGDIATVRKHLAAIESQKMRDALEAYVVLGRRSLALSDHAPNEKAIRRLLTRVSLRSA